LAKGSWQGNKRKSWQKAVGKGIKEKVGKRQ
jgi:hypothetical protein